MLYVGFAISDTMFSTNAKLLREVVNVETVKQLLLDKHIVCANPSHAATFVALKEKYGIQLEVPSKAPNIHLGLHDELLLLSVRGLPRLEGRHEYTSDEIDNAQWSFALWEVFASW